MKVGILGGGQLARMMALAGAPLELETVIYCPTADACAAPYGEHVRAAFDDREALERFAASVDVVTYEFENVPAEAVEIIAKTTPVHPCAEALRVAQDRLNEKRAFLSLGIPTPAFRPVDSLRELRAAVAEVGLPAVLKTRREGYDGKGQAVLKEGVDLEAAWKSIGEVSAIVEGWMPFEREVSIIATRDAAGEVAFYPLSENVHREGMLRLSLSRENDPLTEAARGHIRKLLDHLNYVGTLALELFVVEGGLYANEMAPRVHNSGHWTIEGSRTSQFENHMRAVAGLPLGDAATTHPAAMVNLIGHLPAKEEVLAVTGASYHGYGKSERAGRKVGHVTLVADNGAGLDAGRLARLLELAGESELAAKVAAGEA